MENIKKVLEQNKVILTSSSDDDSDCESLSGDQTKNCNTLLKLKSSKSLTTTKRNGEKRLPTRKPDPNVYNRNALLARENRRRKKMYLESIEKELDVTRKANRTLAKALRRQINIAERLEKEKTYYENLVKSKFEDLTLINSSNFQQAYTENNPIAMHFEENTPFEDLPDIARSRSSSLNETDHLSIGFDSLSDDLYDSTDARLPITSTTWDDDIWGDKDYNVDNFISTNLTILENDTDMQSLSIDHCYARYPSESKVDSSDQESEQSDYVDVEGNCLTNGELCGNYHIFPTYHTPPTQLLNKQSS